MGVERKLGQGGEQLALQGEFFLDLLSKSQKESILLFPWKLFPCDIIYHSALSCKFLKAPINISFAGEGFIDHNK